MDLISIIIPVYNVETYIKRSVNSIQVQSYHNLEIILVDDGSTDGSGKICDTLANQDNRIRVIHKKNGGLSDARNVGLENASGNYIAFLDGDDWYDPNMIELLHNLCIKHSAEIAECSFRSIYTDRVLTETSCSGMVIDLTPVEAIESNLDWKYCKPVAWNKLYRSDIIGTTRYPVGRLHEDEFTTHLFYLAAKKIVYADVALVNYERRNANSITASFKPKNLDACEAFLQKAELTWKKPELYSISKKAGDNYAYILLNRVEICEQMYPNCPELIQTITRAAAVFEDLQSHGLESYYETRMRALFKKYKVHCSGDIKNESK